MGPLCKKNQKKEGSREGVRRGFKMRFKPGFRGGLGSDLEHRGGFICFQARTSARLQSAV